MSFRIGGAQMSNQEARFMADGEERLVEASWHAIEREVRARFAEEIAHAGLFDRMRIEAKIQKEIRVALDRAAPREALY
jgi:hypothetical protein